jgi:DNA topoisomerase-1
MTLRRKSQTPTDSEDRAIRVAAREAGLRLVEPDALRIERRRAGTGFSYLDADGKRITDRATLDRIRSLAIPPAYEAVRIAEDERAHIQAIGRDDAGRIQYRYHPDWERVREQRKVRRLARLVDCLPKIRTTVRRHLGLPAVSREKAAACAVAMIDGALIRVGNEEYARVDGGRGAATLLKRHVGIRGGSIDLHFLGKGGKDISCSIDNRLLARALRQVMKLPGRRLLQYQAEDGTARPLSAAEINAYLREIAGCGVTAKDLRLLGASAAAAAQLVQIEPAESPTGLRRQLAEVIKTVSSELANTPAVCRKSYVHAVVVESFENGALKEAHEEARPAPGRSRIESTIARLVEEVQQP